MKIALVSMPMVDVRTPSLGLTQLKQVINYTFKDSIICDIHYCNHYFASKIGLDVYNILLAEFHSGIGEWLFRTHAFSDNLDTSDEYLQRYYMVGDFESEEILALISSLRPKILDIFFEMIKHYNLTDYDIVGFTSLFHQNVASLAMARILKEHNDSIITCIGGFNVDFPMGVEYIENCHWIDYIFSGPSLVSFPSFVSLLKENNIAKCRELPGVFTKDCLQKKNEDDNYGERLEINKITDLNYDSYLQSFKNYFSNSYIKPYLLYSTAEGCYWGDKQRCTFCAQGGPCGNKMKFKSMEPANAIKIINSLQKYKGAVSFLYSTDNIIAPDYPESVFAKITSHIPIHLEMSTFNLDRKTLRQLSHSGVKVTEAGVESLHTRSLQLMRKGASASRNITFLMDCHLTDIYVVWNYLLGVPGEDEQIYESVFQSIRSLVHLFPPDMVMVTFERFSDYHNNPQKYNLKLEPYPFYFLTYPFNDESIFNLAFDFYNTEKSDYKRALKNWLPKLQIEFENWKEQWDPITKTFPFLYFYKKNNKYFIYDTRNGINEQTEISEKEFIVLKALYSPKTKQSVSEELAFHADDMIDTLHSKRYLFNDGIRYITLVFAEKPKIPSFFI